MRTYTTETQYEFIINYFYTTVDDLGREKLWLSLSDGESARTYRVPAYPYQRTGCEGEKITCKVSKVMDNGYLFLLQNREDVLRGCYNAGETYWFSVLSKEVDHNTQRPFYKLVDRINNLEHRYYCSEETELKGVVGFEVREVCADHIGLGLSSDSTKVAPAGVAAHNPFGHEDNYHEWKSSLVYPAGETDQENPDKDRQIQVIMKCIAGFQNAEGGLLYIGVTDDGEVRGIEDDYSHLTDNDSPVHNPDGYERIIRSAVNQYLGKASLDNIRFNFYTQKSTGRTFCVITISKTAKPVYRNRKEVFKRFGNGYRTLMGDEITDLVCEKMTDEVPQAEFTRPMPEDCLEYNPNIDVKPMQPGDDVVRISKDYIKKLDFYFMTFFSDGTFMYSKDSHKDEEGVLSEVKFNKIDGNLEFSRDILVKCSPDGHAHLLQAYDVCKLGEEGRRIKADIGDTMLVKVAHKYDFLKITFRNADETREKFIRLVSLFGKDTENTLKTNKEAKDIKYQLRLKGNSMIPSGYDLVDVQVVHETLPNGIPFVSARSGSLGIGSLVGSQEFDTASY